MTLGNRISALRKEAKLSQEAIAEALNVSRQAVSKWENDLTVPDMQNLIALAKLLRVDVEYLASGELTEEMDSEPTEEAPKPVPEKKRKHPHRLLCLVLILSLLANVLLVCLWQRERNDDSELLELCRNALYASRSHFASYDAHASEGSYWQGVAEFRRFMQTYVAMLDGDHGAEYSWFNILYGHMIYDREAILPYMEELRRTIRLLEENPFDINAHDEVHYLNNLIEHGDE